MKLLALEVCNLNSFYGKHRIDFERDLGDAPLFVIMGPTGAGKSTLVDAVSLALFGETARLGALSGGASTDDWDEPDARHVLSRGCADAYASLDFSTREDGREVRYRARWSARRARGKADGAPQKPERSLERLDRHGEPEELLVSSAKNKDYAPHFARVLQGLTRDDFHRCMVLPQGEFAAFLRASAGERSEILERLTETSVYKRYGERASQQRADAAQAVRREEDAVAALADAPTTESLAESNARLAIERETLATARDERTRLEAAIAWIDAGARLADELAASQGEIERVEREHHAAAADFTALASHDRCGDARRVLNQVDALERARIARRAERDACEAAKHATASAAESSATALAACELVFTEARAELAARGDEIERARALWSAATAAIERANAADTRANRASDALRARDEAAARLRREEETRAGAASECALALAAADRRATMREDIAAWQARIEALAQARREIARADDELRSRQARADRREHERGKARLRSDAARAAQASAERDLEAATAALRAALGEAPDESHFRRSHAATTSARDRRREVLAACERDLEERVRAKLSIEECTVARKLATRLRDEAEASVARFEAAAARASEEAARERRAREEIAFAIALVSRRGHLHEGEACPLCGSDEHPYANDPPAATALSARANEIEAALASALERHDAAIESRQAARTNAARAAEQMRGFDSQIATGEAAVARVDERLRAAQKLAAGDISLDALRAERRTLADEAERAARSMAAVDTAAALVRSAERTLFASRAEVAERERSLAVLDADAKSDEAERSVRIAERATMLEALEREERALAAMITAHGIDSADLAGAVTEAFARVREADRCASEHANAQRSLAEARANRSVAEALVTEAARDLDRAREEAAQAAAARRDEESARATVLDGRDPRVIQREITERVEIARVAREEAARDDATNRTALAAASESARHAAERLAEIVRDVDESRAQLRAAMESVGYTDEETLRATALDAATETQIRQRRDALREQHTGAHARLRERAERSSQHAAAAPAGITAIDRDRLAARVAEVTQAIEQHALAIATLSATIARASSRSAELAIAKTRLEDARARLDLWQRLHDLIGVRDGDAFRQFAQALNLDELIGRANEHLAQLSPRYLLARTPPRDGEYTLSFAVRDEWHGGELRPVHTLSGGETFIVSGALAHALADPRPVGVPLGTRQRAQGVGALDHPTRHGALALALADQRSVRLPIETLLLDEGFGALDNDTLDVAMAAIESLHARGMQVGIITHVAALRDRVDARVIVEPVGAGRSRVRIEHGPASDNASV